MKILIMSGGGSHGAYQVGVLKCLVEQGKSWDVIAGVSVGALNGAYLAMHNKADIASGVKELENIWKSIKETKDIIKPWAPWIFNYLFAYFKGSLKSTTPLLNLIQSKFDKQALASSDVDFRIGTVCLGKGYYRTIKKTEENIPLWILASSTMPVVMPPVPLEGDLWVDGGVRNQTPVVSVLDVIRECQKKGEDVEVDIILAGPTKKEIPEENPKELSNLLKISLRCLQLAVDEIYISDLDKLDNVKNVTIYEPENVIELDAMEFPEEKLLKLIQTGYEETLKKSR